MTEQVSLARIEEASRVIDPLFRDSPQFVDPQLCAALGNDVIVKVETVNPLGSFKGRGADFFVRDLEPGSRLVCSTGGNFGQALAYAGDAGAFRSRCSSPRLSTKASLRGSVPSRPKCS